MSDHNSLKAPKLFGVKVKKCKMVCKDPATFYIPSFIPATFSLAPPPPVTLTAPIKCVTHTCSSTDSRRAHSFTPSVLSWHFLSDVPPTSIASCKLPPLQDSWYAFLALFSFTKLLTVQFICSFFHIPSS